MKQINLTVAFICAAVPALAAEHSKTDPTQQALVHMLSEAQSREANALVQVYTLRERLAGLEKRLEAEIKCPGGTENKAGDVEPPAMAK